MILSCRYKLSIYKTLNLLSLSTYIELNNTLSPDSTKHRFNDFQSNEKTEQIFWSKYDTLGRYESHRILSNPQCLTSLRKHTFQNNKIP